MNIYIYSDESGVFDKEHNDYFVFGGLIFWEQKTKKIGQENIPVLKDYIFMWMSIQRRLMADMN